MIKSANQTPAERRRLARQAEVQAAACRLVIARGYDGFTMDDLAESVGVSRRTLFNLVHDKESSVLGPVEIDEHPAVLAFRRGEPSGKLLDDLRSLVTELISEVKPDDDAMRGHDLMEQAMAADAKVQSLVNDRFTALAELAADAICEREGWPTGDLRAQALATTLLALIRLTIEEFGRRQDGRPLGAVFEEVLTALRAGTDH